MGLQQLHWFLTGFAVLKSVLQNFYKPPKYGGPGGPATRRCLCDDDDADATIDDGDATIDDDDATRR